MSSRVGILAIGTELTSGQILNTNGHWIKSQIKDLNLEVTVEATIPDLQSLIVETLEWQSHNCDILFVLGGLGPTSDDLTRYAIAKWTHQELRFDKTSWVQVTQKLSSRGVQIKEIQRRVCEFPLTAQILFNPAGTANGFKLKHKHLTIYVLPGPPKEMQGIFAESIFSTLKQNYSAKSTQLRLWQFLGKPESEIAEVCESLISSPRLQIGYRLHRPYVELKIWEPLDLNSEEKKQIEAVEVALEAFLIAKGPLPFIDNFFDALKLNNNNTFHILDSTEEGALSKLLIEELSQIAELPQNENSDLVRLRTRCQIYTTFGKSPDDLKRMRILEPNSLELEFFQFPNPKAFVRFQTTERVLEFNDWNLKYPWKIYSKAYLDRALDFFTQELRNQKIPNV